MSLNVALSSAVSSLIVLEKQMSVASNNVSNANVPRLQLESEQVTENLYGGVGSGVTDLGTTQRCRQVYAVGGGPGADAIRADDRL